MPANLNHSETKPAHRNPGQVKSSKTGFGVVTIPQCPNRTPMFPVAFSTKLCLYKGVPTMKLQDKLWVCRQIRNPAKNRISMRLPQGNFDWGLLWLWPIYTSARECTRRFRGSGIYVTIRFRGRSKQLSSPRRTNPQPLPYPSQPTAVGPGMAPKDASRSQCRHDLWMGLSQALMWIDTSTPNASWWLVYSRIHKALSILTDAGCCQATE